MMGSNAPGSREAPAGATAETNGHKSGVTASRPPHEDMMGVTALRFGEIDPPGPREFVVEGVVPKDHATVVFGDGGSAKSILAMSVGTVVSGNTRSWLGRKVQNFPVLYLDFELDAEEQRRRAYQVARGAGLDRPPRDLLYVSGLVQPARDVFSGCLEVCKREGVGLLILDSLGIALEGDAGDARDVIGFHRKNLDPFRAAGVTLLVVDHQGKRQMGERYQSKRTFGSVYKENLARSVLQVEPRDRGRGLLTVTIRQTKSNFGPKAEPFGVRLTFSDDEITVMEQPLDARTRAQEETVNAADRVMLTLVSGPAYPTEIAESTGMPIGTVKNTLTGLRKRGLVEDTGQTDRATGARQVRLSEDGRTVTSITNI